MAKRTGRSSPPLRRDQSGAAVAPARQEEPVFEPALVPEDEPPTAKSPFLPETPPPDYVAAHRARVTAVAVVIATLFVIVLTLVQTSRSELPDHGDVYTDLENLVAGKRLADAGAEKLRYSFVYDDGQVLGLDPHYYANWPSTGVLLSAYMFETGATLVKARLPMVFVAAFSLIFLFLLARRIGLDMAAAVTAMIALACAAPFHLLADSFSYFTTDTFGRITALYCILTATLYAGWARVIAYAGLFLTVVALLTVSGYETIPSIGLYAGLFPLLALWEYRTAKARARLAAITCAVYGAAFATGAWLRFENACYTLGSTAAGKATLLAAVRFRMQSAPASAQAFASEILGRLWTYYQWHCLVLIVGVCAIAWSYRRRPDIWTTIRTPLAVVALMAVCDSAWLVVARQHSFIHTHTIHQIGPVVALFTAIAASVLLRLLPHRRLAPVAITAFAGAAALAFFDVGAIQTRAHGNLVPISDWSGRFKSIQHLTSVIAPGSVIVSTVGEAPTVEYALIDRGFVIIKRPLDEVKKRIQDRPVYALTYRSPGQQEFVDFIWRYQLVFFNSEFALFQMVERPEMNLSLLQNNRMQNIMEWNEAMWALALHPHVGRFVFPDQFEVNLPANNMPRLKLWLMMPEYNLHVTDGVTVTVEQLGKDDRVLNPQTFEVRPATFGAARKWIDFPLGQPQADATKVRCRIGCGPKGDCNADLVYAFLSLDQT